MRIEYLAYLLEIEKQRSISGAAKSLFLQQTTLNYVLHSVERELGFDLFQRQPHGVRPSPRGERFLKKAREIIALYDDVTALKDEAALPTAPVKLAISSSVAAGLSLPINRQFVQAAPAAALIFLEVPQNHIGSRLIENGANVGISHYSSRTMESFSPVARKYGITVEPLAVDRFFLLVNNNHHLAGRSTADLSELRNERVATGTGFKWAPAGMSLSPLYRNGTQFTAFPNVNLIKKAVLEQDMISVLTGCALYDASVFGDPGFHFIPLTGLVGGDTIDICLFQNSAAMLNHFERTLVDCIRRAVRDFDSRPSA